MDAISQAQICSALMPDKPPDLFSLILRTAAANSSYSGTKLSMGNGSSTIGMLLPGRRTLQYNSTIHELILEIETIYGGGGGGLPNIGTIPIK